MTLSDEDIELAISDVAGTEAARMYQIMKGKKNLSEFKLAEQINKEVHQTRNILYKLHQAGLANFIARKDMKKGWYIHYWTLQPKNIKHLVKNLKKTKLAQIDERLKGEKDRQFYVCENECTRLDFDRAFEFEFKCPECGIIMNQANNADIIDKLTKEKKKWKAL